MAMADAPRPGPIDYLEAEDFSASGQNLLVCLDLSDNAASSRAGELMERTQAIVIGIDRSGCCPVVQPDLFDCLLTGKADAEQPWISVPPARFDERLSIMRSIVGNAPIAATSLCRVLRISEKLKLRDALIVESFAYSTLLKGHEFARWCQTRTTAAASDSSKPYIMVTRDGDRVTLTLNRPDTHNAMCSGMRDALFEGLAAMLDDPTRPTLLLQGAGPCFSSGGSLSEFGTATDPAAAHVVRTTRSCAMLLAELGDRAEVILHGCCIGAGIEIPAAAARRRAHPRAYFQLPELRMGLIPGAGGTATISRAIGRHRTSYMALSGRRIDAGTALDWGLVDHVDPVS